MKILITGICGFVGSSLCRRLRDTRDGTELLGIDNLSRPGSEQNRLFLRQAGIRLHHGDIRCASDVEALPPADWVIDAAANPSALAGIDQTSSPRQVLEHNLVATGNLLEYCRWHGAGLVLLSTSRVYSIPAIARLPLKADGTRFVLDAAAPLPRGVSPRGLAEEFSTAPPVSLYGSTKLASETLALEYGLAFSFPVWINRCGVLAGAGQFGTAEQGIFSYWIHSWAGQRPLRYIGFGGKGHQVRDALHPDDLARLVAKQLDSQPPVEQRTFNLSGGPSNAMSLAELSAWCEQRFGPRPVGADERPRPFDVPWMILDTALAERVWGWKPERPLGSILDEIARHAMGNPRWLELVGA